MSAQRVECIGRMESRYGVLVYNAWGPQKHMSGVSGHAWSKKVADVQMQTFPRLVQSRVNGSKALRVEACAIAS